MPEIDRCLVILLLLAPVGCASVVPVGRNGKVTESKASYADRKEAAIAEFEKHRDLAQVQAAVSCWERGQPQQARAMLEAIVLRAPANLEARLRLAELLAAEDDSVAAEEQLRGCLLLAPESAEAHHALGLLLSDWPGREAEASEHLQRAVQLEPQNAAYAAVAS